MDAYELDQRLLGLGFTVKPGTLRSWTSQGIITGPERYFQDKPEGKGRYVGRRADWPEETVEDVAAYLTLKKLQRQQHRKGSAKSEQPLHWIPKPLIPWVPKLRKFAKVWYETPFICTSLKGKVADDLRTYLASIGVQCYVMFMEFDPLMIWLLTVEKVRHKWPLDKPANVLFLWDIPPEVFKPAMTLEEAIELHLPAMHPTVEVSDAESGEDNFAYAGKMWIDESADFIKMANR